jgi:hypothetical protein
MYSASGNLPVEAMLSNFDAVASQLASFQFFGSKLRKALRASAY